MQQQELTEETIHEGRAALFHLERQLKERNVMAFDNLSDSSSSRQPSSSDRRLMDQLPRNTRLNQRFKSLGITLEELDDRGLINGGGSVPNYYTSMKQKLRRSLELQSRSQRLQERGKEGMSKLLNSIFHMLRVLFKKGFDLESMYKSRDRENCGSVSKKGFVSILKQLGLPFTNKELAEIAIYYSNGSIDFVDYNSFLSDARLLNSDATSRDGRDESRLDPGTLATVVQSVKKMIIDAAKSLQKSPEDIYRMFARWDTLGTGTVTSTQFLRVLARLHVDLSDQDQDFLVELLDTSAMGRIDFDNLIMYCFNGVGESDSPTHFGNMTGLAIAFDDAAGETLSAVSIDGNTSLELKSTSSTGVLRRPHTASLTRPYNNTTFGNGYEQSRSNLLEHKDIGAGQWAHEQKESSSTGKKPLNRPLTASARVLSGNYERVVAKKEEEYAEGLELLDMTEEMFCDDNNQPIFDAAGNTANLNHTAKAANDVPSSSRANQRPNNDHNDFQSDPTEHLVLLAQQILTTLRDIILARYRHGRSLHEIFHHFDRDGKGYFSTRDFARSVTDLRIETSERVAAIAINQLALDGYDQVSFGEFKVFVFDADHKLLELNVQEQLASHLEQQGHEYKAWMNEVFWNEEEEPVNDIRIRRSDKAHPQHQGLGLISKAAFVSGLQKIGLTLTNAEISRLVNRFDVFGGEQCSVIRFVTMVQCSAAWKHAERVLLFQDEAIREAQFLRNSKKELHSFRTLPEPVKNLSEELISMCEYLGIRVLSEQNMIWIAADALKAPLPVNWNVQKDDQGRTFFYNQLTGQSRWEHPLDPHFRKLRDKYRQSSIGEEEEEEVLMDRSRALPNNLKLNNESLPAIPQSVPAFKGTEFNQKIQQRPSSAIEVSTKHNILKPMNNSSKQTKEQDYHYLPYEVKQKDRLPVRPSSATASMQHIIPKQNTSLNNGMESNNNINLSEQAHEWNQRKVVEAIYTNPYYKNERALEKRADNVKTLPRPTAVDRAISVGRGVAATRKLERETINNFVNDIYYNPKSSNSKEAKLAEMVEGNIIEKLDKVIHTRL